MVKYNRRLDAVFQALADPTRRALVAALGHGPASVSDLARPHRMSLPAVMKHLRVLQNAGLVTQRKFGRTRRCRLAARPLQKAEAWISQYRAFWESHFDALDRYLAQGQPEEPEWPKNSSLPKPR
ncbi:MAG TPA: metalloregulator ArsR/SmtB family transcription factor [Candidatus Acidoferrales bacterium]|nr:metalloregulator ArsR/SmtB family transcription factor [Candidatus Acidoferrales bacterium]